MTAKDLRVAPIASRDANALIRKLHYSGKVVVNSQLHLGVFLSSRLEGAMQFGPSLDRRKLRGAAADPPRVSADPVDRIFRRCDAVRRWDDLSRRWVSADAHQTEYGALVRARWHGHQQCR